MVTEKEVLEPMAVVMVETVRCIQALHNIMQKQVKIPTLVGGDSLVERIAETLTLQEAEEEPEDLDQEEKETVHVQTHLMLNLTLALAAAVVAATAMETVQAILA
jgi:hypothetical protein